MPTVVPELPELFEEAFERAGAELRSGYDLKTIRRSLNLLCLEWANRGLNLFTVDGGVIPLLAGQASYALPGDKRTAVHLLGNAVCPPVARDVITAIKETA